MFDVDPFEPIETERAWNHGSGLRPLGTDFELNENPLTPFFAFTSRVIAGLSSHRSELHHNHAEIWVYNVTEQ